MYLISEYSQYDRNM